MYSTLVLILAINVWLFLVLFAILFYYVSFKMTISVFSDSCISKRQIWGLPCLNSAISVPTLWLLRWSWRQECFVLVRAEPGIWCCCIWSCRRIVDVFPLSLRWIACVRKFQNPSKLFQRHHDLEEHSSILYQDRTSWSEPMWSFLCWVFPGCQPVTNWEFLPSSVMDVDVPGVCEPFWSVINKGREVGTLQFYTHLLRSTHSLGHLTWGKIMELGPLLYICVWSIFGKLKSVLTHSFTHMHTHVNLYTFATTTHTHLCIHTHLYTHTHMHSHTHTYEFTHKQVYICMYKYISPFINCLTIET